MRNLLHKILTPLDLSDNHTESISLSAPLHPVASAQKIKAEKEKVLHLFFDGGKEKCGAQEGVIKTNLLTFRPDSPDDAKRKKAETPGGVSLPRGA